VNVMCGLVHQSLTWAIITTTVLLRSTL